MSESYVSASSTEPASDQSGKVDTAKQEASDLKDTATEQAKNVAGTAKDEVKNVAGEAKSQAQGLYAQTRDELRNQAGTQQQRVASGLRSASDDLDSMAANSQNGGVASDLVRNVSQRLGSAASWLEDRDPQSVLDDVRSYARRRPAVFIGGALVLGLVAGRLTRALASNAREDAGSSGSTGARFTGSGVGAPNYPTDYTSADTGYASTLPVDAADTAPSGTYSGSYSAGGVGYGASDSTAGLGGASDVAGGGYGGGELEDTGINAVDLDDSPTEAAGYDIPGGAANVTTDEERLMINDTPVYDESVSSYASDLPGEGDDDRSDRV